MSAKAAMKEMSWNFMFKVDQAKSANDFGWREQHDSRGFIYASRVA